MSNKYKKFIVERLTSTRSGNYAVYTDDGYETWTKDFGYKEGDTVETWGHDGYVPERIDVNGKTIWTEDDKRKWWKDYDPESRTLQNPYRQQ